MNRFRKIWPRTVKFLFIVLCFYICSLLFRQERLPEALTNRLAERFSSPSMIVSIGGIDFGMPHGLRLHDLKVFNKESVRALEPVVAAETVELHPISSTVRAVGLKLTRLHDGYYEVGTVTEALGENNGRFSFPRLPDFELTLVRPEILGVAPAEVRSHVTCTHERLDFFGIHLIWPDADAGEPLTLDGNCCIDLDNMRVFGAVSGVARQAHIRPMLGDYERPVTLDVPVALPYMDAFTEITEPVRANCTWNVNLVNNDFRLHVGVNPTMGKYNGVPLKEANGGINLHVWWVNGRMEFETRVDVDSACDSKGRRFNGHIAITETNGVRTAALRAASDLKMQDTLDIMGYLNDGQLACAKCTTPPQVSIDGILAIYERDRALNDLHGKIACEDGSIFGIAVSNMTTKFSYVGDTVRFENTRGVGRNGGEVQCNATLKFPSLDGKGATYTTSIDYRNGAITELADVFHFDLGKRHGKASGHVELSGPLDTNQVERLCGAGHVKVLDGHIAQMKLFMGLTDLLAEKVPGVGSVVNQSDAFGDFTITNGVFKTDNVRIEGSLFSISADGTYDITRDDLDFTVRVRLMKDDSTPGLRELIRMISWPFSKLLMEFKVRGKIDDPKWEYVSIIDRVL